MTASVRSAAVALLVLGCSTGNAEPQHGEPTEMLAYAAVAAGANVLVVDVRGLRNDRGHVLVAVYDRADGFPKDRDAACRWGKVSISDRTAELRLDDLEPGTYAVAIMHDENDNGRMDKTRLGIPKEGFGMSGYDELVLAVPRFRRASFDFEGGEQTVAVQTHYMR